MEKYLPYIIGIVICFTILIIIFLARRKPKYEAIRSMLSPAENYFYYLLVDIVPKGYTVVPQPALITIFKPIESDIASRNKIISKRLDFAILKDESKKEFPYRELVTKILIELDDKSHDKPERIERDKFVQSICDESKVPLLRYRCLSNSNPNYNKEKIKMDILTNLK